MRTLFGRSWVSEGDCTLVEALRRPDIREAAGKAPAGQRILLVDDDPGLLKSMARTLRALGYDIETACNGRDAFNKLQPGKFSCVVSDISMPEMSGIQLLNAVREKDLDVPIILVTGEPTVDTAVQALQYGALHYLAKPVDVQELQENIERGTRLHRMALMKRQAMNMLGGAAVAGDLAGLEASFASALDKLWMAYQPIVWAKDGTVYGYEALLRSEDASLSNPGAILDAAERLDRLNDLSRTIRDRVAYPSEPADFSIFVNLHPRDLLDDHLLSERAPLTSMAERVILEITERTALDDVPDARKRVARLREMGFRIAVDDLGAGYAGLTSFATLEPEIVKLDMSLIRDVHEMPTKRKLIESMTQLCKDMGMLVVAEGVETEAERDTLIEIGCDLLQGYLLGRPGRPFPRVTWK